MRLYQETSAAAATMMTMPLALTATCISSRLDTSVNTKWPAKDRNTPRQKVSSECWPQTIAGQNTGDFSAGQARGTNQTVITASEKKCSMRSTSRLVLEIG